MRILLDMAWLRCPYNKRCQYLVIESGLRFKVPAEQVSIGPSGSQGSGSVGRAVLSSFLASGCL